MKPLLRSNLLVQFSAISFVLLVAIAVAISMVLTTTLSRDIDLLRVHGKAMTSGIAIEDTDDHSIQNLVGDAKALRWVIYASVAISFVMLYGLLIMTVWLGWNTMAGAFSRSIRSSKGRSDSWTPKLMYGRRQRRHWPTTLRRWKRPIGS